MGWVPPGDRRLCGEVWPELQRARRTVREYVELELAVCMGRRPNTHVDVDIASNTSSNCARRQSHRMRALQHVRLAHHGGEGAVPSFLPVSSWGAMMVALQ
jgi:hypothetical protein